MCSFPQSDAFFWCCPLFVPQWDSKRRKMLSASLSLALFLVKGNDSHFNFYGFVARKKKIRTGRVFLRISRAGGTLRIRVDGDGCGAHSGVHVSCED
ncbi:unnamed protein product [Lampetra planeri]